MFSSLGARQKKYKCLNWCKVGGHRINVIERHWGKEVENATKIMVKSKTMKKFNRLGEKRGAKGQRFIEI